MKGYPPIYFNFISKQEEPLKQHHDRLRKTIQSDRERERHCHMHLTKRQNFKITMAHKPPLLLINKPTKWLPPLIEKWVMDAAVWFWARFPPPKRTGPVGFLDKTSTRHDHEQHIWVRTHHHSGWPSGENTEGPCFQEDNVSYLWEFSEQLLEGCNYESLPQHMELYVADRLLLKGYQIKNHYLWFCQNHIPINDFVKTLFNLSTAALWKYTTIPVCWIYPEWNKMSNKLPAGNWNWHHFPDHFWTHLMHK